VNGQRGTPAGWFIAAAGGQPNGPRAGNVEAVVDQGTRPGCSGRSLGEGGSGWNGPQARSIPVAARLNLGIRQPVELVQLQAVRCSQ